MNEPRTHDTLGRRYRDRPNSKGKRITLTDRDLLWFEKLHRHGPLSSSFLREYVRLAHRTDGRALDRLTDLFNEDNTAHGGRYLDRPWQQFATLDARYHDLAYDVTKFAAAALDDEGRLRDNAPATAPGSWKHDFMCSAITSSMELAILQRPDEYGFIFHDEIASHRHVCVSGCHPAATRGRPLKNGREGAAARSRLRYPLQADGRGAHLPR